ncbi:hypothetical protein NBRC10512_000075 [Rhodotorula toruloides]|uniref:RHTO0S09e03884g1_1 n=2 Tax=Rhodotorula toruloides TaxID=5286 RepID=A0A061B393_RHOTO|nr:fungal specific transcription factor [Rhodotorula toruloides NP11]EMS22890.1 fungal specific transcription factor [Rhodotorula toruloides NP11]CDR44412.1 RHTO0S09e03884g1_1 [Rhodotorula toruloides]
MDVPHPAGAAAASNTSSDVPPPPPPPPPPGPSKPPGPPGSSSSRDFSRRKKRTHASCEGCRQRKQKCSRETVCTNCRLRNTPCVYIDAAPTAFSANNPTVEEQLADAREEIRRLQGQIDRLTQENAYRSSSEPVSSSDDPAFDYQTLLPSLFRPRAGRVPIPSFPLGPGNPYSYSYPNTPYYEPRHSTPYADVQFDTPSYFSSLETAPFAQPTASPIASTHQGYFPPSQGPSQHLPWPAGHIRHQTYPPVGTHPYEPARSTPASLQPYQPQQSSSSHYQQYAPGYTGAGALAGPSSATLPYYASSFAQPAAQNFTTLEQAIVPPQPRATYVYAADSTPTPTATAFRPAATAHLEDVDDGAVHWTGQLPLDSHGQGSSSFGGGTWAPPRVKEEPED